MRLPHTRYPYLSFTEPEERELAHRTFDMLANPRFIRHDQYEFLKNKFYIGRGCFGRSISELRFSLWLDVIQRHNRIARTELEFPVLTLGMRQAVNDHFTDDVKAKNNPTPAIIGYWHDVWETHPVRRSAEIFKEWMYPEVWEGRELMNKRVSRITRAIETEKDYWDQIRLQRGRFSDPVLVHEYVSEYHRTATHVLHETDKQEWLRRIDEISEKIPDAPKEILISRVEEFDPKPDHLYLVNYNQYRSALREWRRSHPSHVEN